MNTSKVYDPESIRTDYQERKRRNRRVQVPPLSYWQDGEKEYIKATTDIMDMVIITISFLALFGLMFAVCLCFKIFWFLPVSLLMFVMWHMAWGRR